MDAGVARKLSVRYVYWSPQSSQKAEASNKICSSATGRNALPECSVNTMEIVWDAKKPAGMISLYDL